ncbi:MAG: hypothetical protein H5U06_01885 [Candidatus Aminicenantes bacterium]|nr:hypothetical protein [Candidatus Aminicenantes bacterium]
MEEQKYVSQLPRVSAPPGFEQMVLARLREEKSRRVRLKRLEWSLAGAVALFLIAILVLTSGLKKPEYSVAGIEKNYGQEKVIPVVEPIDLRKEMMKATDEPQTVFILEQVSDGLIQQVRY